VNAITEFQKANPNTAAIITSPHSAAVVIALISCLALSPIPEPPTIEVLFGYQLLNFALLSVLILKSASPAVLIEYWLLPNFTYIAACVVFAVIGRLVFSSLCRFPGPKVAAASKYWMAKELGNGTFSTTVKKLHKKYNAPVVRTGPNELSVNDAEAIVKIYGGKYQRGPFYEGAKLRGCASIQATRNQDDHVIWRRIW